MAQIEKLLVANRGEIAIRVFRAAYELGIETVAVYTWEDRQSLHRMKADEAYQIGARGHPLKPYLDPAALVEAAERAGADAVHPGYGFLAESPDLADACVDAGLIFVGPTAESLRIVGSKMRGRRAAAAAGLPVLSQSDEVTPDTAAAAAEEIGYPLFVKAASGGGGRGLRRIDDPGELAEAVAIAKREAASAFGDPTVFLERAVVDARHIEVQLLGDGGEVVHLYERDCSVQRRHQKVIEIAPAPQLATEIRDAICRSAVDLGRHLGYVNAGTVEFLVDHDGHYVFIEMNPRIQVEHTVTEETTDVDIVRAQLEIAAGKTLADLGLVQDRIEQRGAALQCRITTEDPSNGFRPDTGRILAYRDPGGAGIRLDAGGGYAGAEILPYFDSMLTKLTCRGPDFETALARARRAVAEFRVRGPVTNIAFLQAVLGDAEFQAGGVTTSFIDERPELAHQRGGSDRATRLLVWLGEMTVNRPHGPPPAGDDPTEKLPTLGDVEPPPGTRQLLIDQGPASFARWMRSHEGVLLTDTTMRDAHQSTLATRVRTIDLVAGAAHVARRSPELLSLECWGGATYDVALRFLHEDPWDRLDRLRDAVPNICLQMLLRGRNTVGYDPAPDAVCRAFVDRAAAGGIDVFRIFDALNNVDPMRPAIEAALTTGALVEGAICYSGDLIDPHEDLFTLDYYLAIAEQLVRSGVHVLCIKDMAGLLTAPAATVLVSALRERFEAPVHLHTHDTAGGQLATYLAAAVAGVDAIDGAAAPLSGLTSQPPLPAIVASLAGTDRASEVTREGLAALEPYWEAVRRLYEPFEAGLRSPTGTVYDHEIPGGQLANLRQQALAVGLGGRFEEIERAYAASDDLFGRITKVTPSSKVVGDLALAIVASGTTVAAVAADPGSFDLPDSVIGFLHGELGVPPAGFPEPFRTEALAGRRARRQPPEPTTEQLGTIGGDDGRDALSAFLFPTPFADYCDHVTTYGDLSRLPTRLFLYGMSVGETDARIVLGPGVELLVGLDAIGEPDDRGMRRVVFHLNGQLRAIDVLDQSVEVSSVGGERADPGDPGQVPAPFTGVVTLQVEPGDRVNANQGIAVIEAMKMESVISAPVAGTVERLAVPSVHQVEAGDLLVVIRR